MKILLDECVSKRLKPFLTDYEVSTVRERLWSGIKNRKLLTLCVEHGYDVLLTIDKNMPYQQFIEQYSVTVAIFNCRSSSVEELVLFLPAFRAQSLSFEKHKAYVIDK